MKHLVLFFFATLIGIFSSCSRNKGNDEIIVKPNTTIVYGDMGECFEIIDRSYKATGNWANGIITVEVKRTEEPIPFELNNRELVSFSTTMFDPNVQVGFGIEFFDKDGNIIDKVSANGSGFSGSYDTDEAVILTKLKPGQTGSIRFSIDDAAKSAVSFRLSTAYKENGNSNAPRSNFSSNQERILNLEGNIGKYPIMMTLNISSTREVTGAYYYKSKGPGNYLYLKGDLSGEELSMNEFNKKGKQTGSYQGSLINDTFTGSFVAKSGSYDVNLSEAADMESIDFGYIDFSDFIGENLTNTVENIGELLNGASNTSVENSDFTKLLDKLDKAINSMSVVINKYADSNTIDITASLKAAESMMEAQELIQKLEEYQPELNAEQLKKYMSLMEKMAAMTPKILKIQQKAQSQLSIGDITIPNITF